MLKDALRLGLMTKEELSPEDNVLVFPTIAEEWTPDYVPRPFSYDTGDFEPPEEEGAWKKHVPRVSAPEQESLWPFYLEWALKLFLVLCAVIGFSFLITGPH